MDFGRFGSSSVRDIAIDLGTANTLVYVPGQGIIIDEPSVVAIEYFNGSQQVKAVGSDAKILIGKTPENIRTYRPLTDGVISDLDMAELMIKHFIQKANGQSSIFSRGPDIVICVPSGATEVVRRAIRAAAREAGGRDVWLVEAPRAAASSWTVRSNSTPARSSSMCCFAPSAWFIRVLCPVQGGLAELGARLGGRHHQLEAAGQKIHQRHVPARSTIDGAEPQALETPDQRLVVPEGTVDGTGADQRRRRL